VPTADDDIDPGPALSRSQRQMVIGVCLAVAGSATVSATVRYMLPPMLEDLDLTRAEAGLALEIPSVAAILVVFLAGVLGDRLGQRRVITFGALAFLGGSVVVAVAPSIVGVSIGLLGEGIGASTMSIVALGMLGSRLQSGRARAAAFAAYAAVNPIVHLTMPLAAGAAVDRVGWRFVPLVWIVVGLTIVFAARFLLPREGGTGGSGELLTPLLAGVGLAAGVVSISRMRSQGITAPAPLAFSFVAALALLACVLVYRRRRSPSLQVSVLRRGAFPILLIIVVLAPFANLWFYMMLVFEYVYDTTATATAALMVPAEVAGIVGAALAGRLIARKGVRLSGTVLLLATAVTLLLTLLVRPDSPIWVPALVVALFAGAAVAASIPVTNALMNAAPPDQSSGAAAFRGAASNIGNALGVALMGALVFGTMQQSFVAELTDAGVREDSAEWVMEYIEENSRSPDPAARYPIPTGLAPVTSRTTPEWTGGSRPVERFRVRLPVVCDAGLPANHRR
jgi:predicted MFS family arabinose efflux permease